MAENTGAKKRTTAILAIIAAIFVIAATIGVVAFLKDKGSAEAVNTDSNQTLPEAGPTGDNQAVEENQSTDNKNNNQETSQRNNVPGTGENISNNSQNADQETRSTSDDELDNIQETEITETQTNSYERGTDGRYLSWQEENVNIEGAVADINANSENELGVKVEKRAEINTGKELANPGDEITYIITVTSEKEANEIDVTDEIPEMTTFKSAENNAQEISDDNDTVIGLRWTVSLNKENEYKTEVRFTVTVNEDAEGIIVNAEVYANGEKLEEPTETKLMANIVYEENGGTEVEDLLEKPAGDEIEDRTMPETTRAGYDFDGWFDNEEQEGEAVEELPETYPQGTTTYYAKWIPRDDTKYIVEFYYEEEGQYPEEATNSVTRTGKTDTTAEVTETDKEPTQNGYIYDEAAENVLSGNIAGDGSLVLRIYFKEQFTVKYLKGDHGTFTGISKTNIDYGTETPAYDGATGEDGKPAGEAGYTFTGWEPQVAEKVTENAEYVAQWEANPDTAYTVEFYYEEDGEYPEKATSSETRTGETDTTAEVTDSDKIPTQDGYVFDEAAENVLSGNIAGDGSLVLKLYFKEQFTVTYKPGTKGTFEDIEKTEIDYGTTTPEYDGATGEDGKPSGAAGYTFTGWEPQVARTVTENAEYVAQWVANGDTQYKVEYYYQSEGRYPEEATNSVTRTGETDTTANVTNSDKIPTQDGYVYDEDAENILSGNIAGNGSLVLKVYFKQQLKVVYKPGEKGTFEDIEKTEIDYGTTTPEYDGATGEDGKPAGEAGYTFTGWEPQVAETVTENAEYVAQWEANKDTQYTVEYYYQEEGEYPEEATNSVTRTGETDATANVTDSDKEPTQEGYVYDEAAENVLSGNIAGDGSLVLKIYFKEQFTVTYKPGTKGTFEDIEKTEIDYGTTTPEYDGATGEDGKPAGETGYTFTGWSPEVARTVTENAEYVAQWVANGDTQYKVEYYYQSEGRYPEEATSSVTRTGETDTTANVTNSDKVPTQDGYVFDEAAENVLSGNIAGDGSLVLKLYFKEQFTVTYKPGEKGTFEDIEKTEIDYGTETPAYDGATGEDGKPAGEAGYTFTGWKPQVAETVTENAEYVAQWEANGDTQYKVEYYYQSEGRYPEEATSSVTRTGETDTTAEVTDSDKTPTQDGYVYDEEAENVLSGNIAGDGSLVLKIFFKQQFTVKYLKGEHGTFTEETYTVDYGEEVPAFKGKTTGEENYVFTKWDTDPTQIAAVTENLTFTAQWQKVASYSVRYFFNGVEDTQYGIPSSETQGIPIGTSFDFENIPEGVTGYEYISYTIDGVEGAEKIIKEADNEVKVYLGKPEVTIKKEETTSNLNAGDSIGYKITVTNTGHVGASTVITDTLQGTTYNEDANITPTVNESTLTWNIDLGPATASTPTMTNKNEAASKSITFSAKTPNNSIGKTFENTATSDIAGSSTITTTLNEVSVDYQEIMAGREGTDLNIIFIVDNSSSMNQTVAGESYTNTDTNAPVAPSDRSKTRIENAKSAINSFIDLQNSNPNNTMTVIKFNVDSSTYNDILVTEGTGYDVQTKTQKYIGYYNRVYLTETSDTVTYRDNTYTLYKGSDDNDYIIIRSNYGTEYAYRYYDERNIGSANSISTRSVDCIEVNGEDVIITSHSLGDSIGTVHDGTASDGTTYVVATDGKAYKYTRSTVAQGAVVLGTTLNGASTNSQLKTAVTGMTIGDAQSSYSTHIYPALDKVNSYVDESKTNIVIVLTDGEFNDTTQHGWSSSFDSTRATNLLVQNGGKVDSIYSIAFGSLSNDARTKLASITNIYEKDANGNNTSTKKIYDASNASTLLDAFKAIEESAQAEAKNGDTTVGEIELDSASNGVIVTENCPIKVINKDTEAVILECKSEATMASYGLHFEDSEHTKIRWDANEFVTNNPDGITDLKVPKNVKLTYYVPYSG